jgi:hypothetical protein
MQDIGVSCALQSSDRCGSIPRELLIEMEMHSTLPIHPIVDVLFRKDSLHLPESMLRAARKTPLAGKLPEGNGDEI